MKQKPNDKKKYKRPAGEKKNSAGDNAKKPVHSDGKVKGSITGERPSAQRGSSYVRREQKYKYTGSFDLADSFEAEERKKAASAAEGSGRERQENKKSAPKKNTRSKKEPFEERRPAKRSFNDEIISEIDVEGGIKTRAKCEYIPFDSGNDDDIDPSFFYGEERAVPAFKGESAGRRRKTEDGGILGIVAGRNAVRELLKSGRSVDKLYVKGGDREGSIVVIIAEAAKRRIPVIEVSQEKLSQITGGANHQGVAALAAEKQYVDVEGILKIAKDRGEKPLIVIADGIEDPQNLGALIRCAECAGAHGVIIPKRRSVGLTPIVAKASAGAIEHVAVAKVTNLSDTIVKLQKEGVWVFAAEAGGAPYYETDFNVPAAIVLGSEGFGVSRLVKERADAIVSIPMYGKVNSLNVSAAASVILCHAARMQRT